MRSHRGHPHACGLNHTQRICLHPKSIHTYRHNHSSTLSPDPAFLHTLHRKQGTIACVLERLITVPSISVHHCGDTEDAIRQRCQPVLSTLCMSCTILYTQLLPFPASFDKIFLILPLRETEGSDGPDGDTRTCMV